MARYFFHNIYGDSQNLLDTKPSDVEAIPFGWDETAETVRNNKLTELNNDNPEFHKVGIGSLPTLIYWREAWTQEIIYEEDVLTQDNPAQWFEVSFSDIFPDMSQWTWANMEQYILDNH